MSARDGRDDGRPARRRDERGLLDAEHLTVWFLTVVLVTSIVGSVVLYADDVRDTTPDSEFGVDFDEDTRTITVGHIGGEPVTDRNTHRLAVVVIDVTNGTSERVAWAEDEVPYADRGRGFPVSAGDRITIDDPTVDADGDGNYDDADASVGFRIAATDRVRVVWTGLRRSGATTTVELFNSTVTPGDATTRFEQDE